MSAWLCLLALSARAAFPAGDLKFKKTATPVVYKGEAPEQREKEVAVALRLEREAPNDVCTGTLIGPRAVLTAAHCLQPDDSPARLPRSANGYTVRAAIIHARFDRKKFMTQGDVAVLLLGDDAPESHAVARLWREPKLPEGMRLAGAGRDENGRSGEVRTAPVTEVPVHRDHAFVKGAGAASACAGDSGGPSFAPGAEETTVAAITSAGVGTYGECNGGESLTRVMPVAQYADWIDAAVRELPALKPGEIARR